MWQGRVFVKPEERVLPFHALIDALGPQPPPTHDTAQAPPFVGVPYLSQQVRPFLRPLGLCVERRGLVSDLSVRCGSDAEAWASSLALPVVCSCLLLLASSHVCGVSE